MDTAEKYSGRPEKRNQVNHFDFQSRRSKNRISRQTWSTICSIQ